MYRPYTKDNYCRPINLLKIWSKLVDWFTRYSKKKYIGQVDLNLFIGQKCFLQVVCVREKCCHNLVNIVSKLVNWFKRYRKNKNVDQVYLI